MQKNFRKKITYYWKGNTARNLTKVIRENDFTMYNLLGYISANNIEGVHQDILVDENKILGTYEEIEKVIEEQNINEVIIAMPLADNAQMLEIINNLDGKVNKVKFTPELNGVYTFNSEIENYDGTMLISAKIKEGNRIFYKKSYRYIYFIIWSFIFNSSYNFGLAEN